MPGGDRTGPMGQGSMTGRRLGFCVDNYRPRGGFQQFGGGFGRGRGMGFRGSLPRFPESYQETYSTENEVEILYRQAKDLKETLNRVEERLAQLEKKPTEADKE